MRIEKYSDVKILYINNNFSISIFKKGERKINKSNYRIYGYDKAINFGLFYIAFGKNTYSTGWSLDFSSKLGTIRFFKHGEEKWENILVLKD